MAVSIKLGTCGGINYTATGSLTFFPFRIPVLVPKKPPCASGLINFKSIVRLWNKANIWDPTSYAVLQSHQIAEAGVVRRQCWDSVFPKCAIRPRIPTFRWLVANLCRRRCGVTWCCSFKKNQITVACVRYSPDPRKGPIFGSMKQQS